ncbi:MAG TPA: hypothetical protein VFL82_03480 [Thermomicrobiales bacterium]|nr:hypothetical protein [Thermomicrobiales bacterium]
MSKTWLCPMCGPVPGDVSCGSRLAPRECTHYPGDDAPCEWCGIVPAEVEALRARCERLRRVAAVREFDREALKLEVFDLWLEAGHEVKRQLAELQPGDLADDLRDLDDLPPLKLAGNPLDDGGGTG